MRHRNLIQGHQENKPNPPQKKKNKNKSQDKQPNLAVPIAILSTVFFLLAADLVVKEIRKQKSNAKITTQKDSLQVQTASFESDKVEKTLVKNAPFDTTFSLQQRRFNRVRDAYQLKFDTLKATLYQAGVDTVAYDIYLRAFKKEQVLEVWAKGSSEVKFKFVKSYAFCKSSGTVGPKRREGDKQIPEGFYHIDRFNPSSNYYLSLGINYPNRADQISTGDSVNLGKDIFIHGGCETVGCIPITNDQIKELYVLATEAKSRGQKKISITIYPTKLTDGNFKALSDEYAKDKKLVDFWKTLKRGYDYFEGCKELPTVRIPASGRYVISDKCK
ncbi:MAG TPA: hypothetical protein DCM08_12040 [Microscillaceae bacterium]|jgi:murein L,D-transpeptidase YafK|nr:hypothetical protein [Microscillaceae bacterium]